MAWTDNYKLKGIEPGVIYHPKFGYIDFASPNVPEEICERLVKEKSPYLDPIIRTAKRPPVANANASKEDKPAE